MLQIQRIDIRRQEPLEIALRLQRVREEVFEVVARPVVVIHIPASVVAHARLAEREVDELVARIVAHRPRLPRVPTHPSPAEVSAVAIHVRRSVAAILRDTRVLHLVAVLHLPKLVPRLDAAEIELLVGRPRCRAEGADFNPPVVLLPVHGHEADHLAVDAFAVGELRHGVIGFRHEEVDHLFFYDPRAGFALGPELDLHRVIALTDVVVVRRAELLDE